eukprot:TRINITY_DN8156_c0_g1_i1.p1 TRINITY_DN8156_c0_g1~~TRINITY_DN8156_c0_g1_i1.p1  ORF type:complete len:792 (+),score=118.64 TRINITY_DN8156_c0_g1_i1:1682-4057(+)
MEISPSPTAVSKKPVVRRIATAKRRKKGGALSTSSTDEPDPGHAAFLLLKALDSRLCTFRTRVLLLLVLPFAYAFFFHFPVGASLRSRKEDSDLHLGLSTRGRANDKHKESIHNSLSLQSGSLETDNFDDGGDEGDVGSRQNIGEDGSRRRKLGDDLLGESKHLSLQKKKEKADAERKKRQAKLRKPGKKNERNSARTTSAARPELLRPKRFKRGVVLWRGKPRIAICLVGAARFFHLTGPTIVKHLLSAYPTADVFLHSPLDEDAHRLSVLLGAAPNVVKIRIAPDVPINETDVTDLVVRWVRAGAEYVTRQQLMQQFKAVEMCVPMISSFERSHKFQYKWVMRTRVDTFWNGPPPELEVFDSRGYTIPAGSDWGGLNDRLGVGRRSVGLKGLRRLSVIPGLASAGYAKLNAERMYLAQMEHLHVKITRASFPFCILSKKKGNVGFPVAAALSSTAELNGAKCRPCEPALTGREAEQYIASLPAPVFGPTKEGVDLCEAVEGWGQGWENIFDRDAGYEMGLVRDYMMNRSMDDCIQDWKDFHKSVPNWDAPPPRVLCVRSKLGRLGKVGQPDGDWPLLKEHLAPGGVVYSLVVGQHFAWDHAMMKHQFVDIHAFDATPEGLRWVGDALDWLPPEWHHHPWMLGTSDGNMTVYGVDREYRPFQYATTPSNTKDDESLPGGIFVESKTIESTMALLGHDRVDVLRLGGHFSLHESLFDKWIADGKTPAVCQVLISFHKDDKHMGTPHAREQLLRLRAIGLELAQCIQRGAIPKDRVYEGCLLFSVIHCPYKN